MTPRDFNANSRLRASDADRDKAASVLNQALAEGRLTAEEHSERLDSIYQARTHADLVPLIEDLPATQPTAAPAVAEPAEASHGGLIVAIFGGATRKGAWRPPRTSTVVNVFGGSDIDLRDAVLPGREVTIRAITVFGGLGVTIPPEMRVTNSGFAMFGGQGVLGDSPESAGPDAPVLHMTGVCVFGGVGVMRKQRENRDN